MGRLSTISYEEVAREAERLTKENLNPTVNGIAKLIGGNSKTVSQHLTQWRINQEKEEGLSDRLLNLIDEIKQTAIEEAQTKINQVWDDVDAEKEKLKEERQVFEIQIAELKKELEAEKKQNDQYQDQLEQAKRETKDLRLECLKLTEEKTKAFAASEKYQQLYETLKYDNEQLKTQVKHFEDNKAQQLSEQNSKIIQLLEQINP